MVQNKRYKQSRGLYQQTLDGVHLVLNENNGECFQLNPVGKCILDSLEKDCSKEELTKMLTKSFNISEKDCDNAIHFYLKALQERELLIVI